MIKKNFTLAYLVCLVYAFCFSLLRWSIRWYEQMQKPLAVIRMMGVLRF